MEKEPLAIQNINQLPFIVLENTDLILYIDFNILCINIKTGELISYFKIPEEYKYNIYPYCLLTNYKFLIFTETSILKFEFSDNKIKQIEVHFDFQFNKDCTINWIYKIFNENYVLINEHIMFEKEPNHFESILEFKEKIENVIPVNFLRKTNEEYFIAKNKNYEFLLIKLFFNSFDNKLTYIVENIKLNFFFFQFKFVNDTNLLFYCGYSYPEREKFVIYNLKNRSIINKFRGEDYDKTLGTVIPTIKNIYKNIRIKHSLNLNLTKGYKKIYFLKNYDDEEYFISKNEKSEKYEFKIYKYKL